MRPASKLRKAKKFSFYLNRRDSQLLSLWLKNADIHRSASDVPAAPPAWLTLWHCLDWSEYKKQWFLPREIDSKTSGRHTPESDPAEYADLWCWHRKCRRQRISNWEYKLKNARFPGWPALKEGIQVKCGRRNSVRDSADSLCGERDS